VELGAKYLAHGMPPGADIQVAKDFVVVDVGLVPETKAGIAVSKSQFTLSINGKTLVTAQSPGSGSAAGSIAASRDASSRTGSVELGGPPIQDHRSSNRELESMPRRPISLESPEASGPSRKGALPEGLTTKPVSGYLFFRFDGDVKAIRSLELLYDSGSGSKARIRIL